MSEFPPCPACKEEITYPDRENYVCATCGHEWSMDGEAEQQLPATEEKVVRDAHGTPLADGDTVTLIKDLRLKGSSTVLKWVLGSPIFVLSMVTMIWTAGSMGKIFCSSLSL